MSNKRIKLFDSFKSIGPLDSLVEIIESDLYDDFGIEKTSWWRAEKNKCELKTFWRENGKLTGNAKNDPINHILVEITSKSLYDLINRHFLNLKKEIDDINKLDGYGYIKEYKNIPYLNRIYNLTGYEVYKIFYIENNIRGEKTLGLYFKLDT